MKIYVVRHGMTELNKKRKINGQIDEPLAPEGVKQAEDAVPLIPKSVIHIYTSSLLRTRQTAEIINSKIGRTFSSHDELQEINMGSLAGKSWDEMEGGSELKKKHRAIRFDYRQYGGETAEDVKKRVLAFLKKINKKYGDYEALIVTHGGIIRLLHLLQHGQPKLDEIEHITLQTFNLNKILV